MFRRIWTVIGKMWALPFIFVGGGLVTAIGVPLMSFFPCRESNRALILIQHSFRVYLWLLQMLRIVEIKIEDRDRLVPKSGCVVIANHPSLLDVVILVAYLPKPQCIVKNQFWNHRFLGGLMREAQFIRNDLEPEQLLSACKTSIESGGSLIIFPEGTRTTPGKPPRFQRGFANIAMAVQCPILPVVINCEPAFLHKGEPWWDAPTRKPVFNVSVGEALDANGFFGYVSRSLAARKLSESLENYYGARIRS